MIYRLVVMCTSRMFFCIFLLLWFSGVSVCQTLPSSFPHFYRDIPNTYDNFSDSAAWQHYYLVKEPLPNVTFQVPRSFAGNIPVNRGGPNNTLFFYAFEKAYGSLTAQTSDKPWIIWLNGGPGSSSLAGLFLENGPIRINANYSASYNPFSWHTAADIIYVDQPVGTGYATADAGAYAIDEDQVGTDFMGFLSNLAQIFPSLGSRPFYLIGESYAGKFIPYIVKTYFGLSTPPVNLTKFAIGDGTIAAPEVYGQAPVISTLQTYPQLINFDTSVFEYFVKQAHLCKLDINLSYPQSEPIPTVVLPVEAGPEFFSSSDSSRFTKRQLSLRTLLGARPRSFSAKFKRQGSGFNKFITEQSGDMINPWYGCDLYDEMIDFALNFTFPWSNNNNINGFDPYNIPDALDPEAPLDASVFLNDFRVRKAIHAPLSKNWSIFFEPTYPFNNSFIRGDPSPPPIIFLSDLASNATERGVSWIIYSGNDDSLDAHMGSLITIQNTTFGGIRGFTRPPSTPWLNDDGSLKGIVHQERNLTYVLFNHASHQVPIFAPQAALEFVHEFLLGRNPLGSVIEVVPSGQPTVTVVGGENSEFAGGILPGATNPIYYGSASTQFSTFWPSATISAWDNFISTATAIAAATVIGSSSTPTMV